MTGDATEPAARRARSAASRSRELEELRLRLDAGDHLTPDDLQLAGQRSAEATENARDAHHRAAVAHRRAAAAHLSAADLADQVGDPDAGRRHREAAADDALSADDDEVRGG